VTDENLQLHIGYINSNPPSIPYILFALYTAVIYAYKPTQTYDSLYNLGHSEKWTFVFTESQSWK